MRMSPIPLRLIKRTNPLQTCGVQRWEEISAEQHKLVTKILSSSVSSQSTDGCSLNGLKLPLISRLKNMFRTSVPTGGTPPLSSAAQKYTPARNPSSTASPSRAVLCARLSSSSIILPTQHHPNYSVTAAGTPTAMPNAASPTRSWILFGVKGPRKTLTQAEIPVNSQTTDHSAFQALKNCYQTHRGRLRLWFSIWRLDNCEVVKVWQSINCILWELKRHLQFNKLTPKHLVREHKDLPTHEDYRYTPRAGAKDARNPPFSRHTFEALVYACPSPCTWLIPHDCLWPPSGHTFLARVPKRTKSFMEDQTSPIWGLEAVFAVSFAYVLFYHCLMVVGPLAFWGWWLSVHPDDLQNASIPFTVVIGALSLFWSGAGILTSTNDV